MTKSNKNCLIISYGPVPTPQYQKIEGGGQRCWGLALGLQSKGYNITIAVNDSFPLDTNTVDGIHLINWSENEAFVDAINSFDVVIMNYAMGGPMSYVVDNISDHTTLILDCYVPIYIEVSARDSVDKAVEYSNYSHDIIHYNKALKRGDYFLCANVPQKHMYMGVLSALGIINPYSYKKERVLLVPFGVESSLEIDNPHNPYLDIGIKKDDFVLLWFGGLYPWFNINPLLKTIQRLSNEHANFKFVIVGGKNPYNTNPDFTKQYGTTYDFIKKNDLLDKSVYFVDWVDFSDRINWYRNAGAVVSVNNVGEENIYSWRTRVMDYVWGEVPMITNGGDPLSDSLIANDAAVALVDTEEDTLYAAISKIVRNPSALKDIRLNLKKQKENYYWEKVVEPINEKLSVGDKPYLDEKLFKQEFKPDTVELIQQGGLKHKMQKIARLPRKVGGIIKSKGIKRSAKLVLKTVKNRVVKTAKPSEKQYYFFSHPVDHTGAPLVLLDIIDDYAEHIDRKNLNLIYPGGEKTLLQRVHKMGIRTDKMVLGVGSRVIHGQLGIKKDDFVLLNTVAIYPNYRDYVLGLLERGKLSKATWFIHEDMPELRFDDKGLVARITKLVARGLIEIVVPSQQTANDYNKFFQTDTVRIITLRVSVPNKYEVVRKPQDFDTLRFVISGTPSDGRKGQLLAISAFAKYLNEYQSKNPDNYRSFELHLIAIGEKGDDYISTQIRSIGDGLLGDKIHYYPKVAKSEAMRITSECNVTICSSLNETFALFVAEGMLMGHVLLRNKTSGYEEQLIDQKNGLTIDEQDVTQFSNSIESILNIKMKNDSLLSMSRKSQDLASNFTTSNYYSQIGKQF